MTLEERDYHLLEYLDQFNEPIQLEEKRVPHEIRIHFQFMGLDKRKYPNSIWVRLFELSQLGLVDERYSNMWEITEVGRVEIKSYKKKKNNYMLDDQTVLRFFYKQNRNINIDDLFQKFGTDDRVLRPINYLVYNDWLEELDALEWKITEEGRTEFERRIKASTPQPTHLVTVSGESNILNFGIIEGDINQNIQKLNDSGLQGISKTIEDLVNAIKSTNEIQEAHKNEYLESLKVLSEEALKPKDKRLPPSTLKNIIQFGLGGLNTLSSISTITGLTLKDLTKFFLEQ